MLRFFGRDRLSPTAATPSEPPEFRFMIAAHTAFLAQRRLVPAPELQGIVFSMDRALQLDALLRSIRELVTGSPKLTIIYRVTSATHEKAYREVLKEHAKLAVAKRQESRQDFNPILTETLARSHADCVFFLVDDNLFIERTDLKSFASFVSPYAVPTLRMGANLSRCYTMQRPQRVPFFAPIRQSAGTFLLTWLWKSGALDWNYPLSVDGHFFLRREILALAQSLDFDSPNRFEEQLQKFHLAFGWRLGICHQKSRLINIPYNKVQTDNANISGAVHQEDMLRMWNEGQRIDQKSYVGTVNESAHEELPLRLMRRSDSGRR